MDAFSGPHSDESLASLFRVMQDDDLEYILAKRVQNNAQNRFFIWALTDFRV